MYDYENAIRDNTSELHCNLLAETHACLLAMTRERPGAKCVAMDSLEAQESAEEDVDPWRSVHARVSLADIAHEVKGLGYKTCASATGFGGARSNGPETARESEASTV